MRLRLFVAFAVFSLAGPAALAAEPVGDTLPWNTLRCHFVYATVTVPVARIADRVPANFRPYTMNTATANSVTDLTFEADSCEEGSGVADQIAPMAYASTWSPAIPPPRYDTELGFTVLAWDLLVPDDERRALLADAGAPVHDGDVVFGADLSGAMPTTPFTVDWGLDGIGAFHLDIVPARDIGDGPGGEFDQYVPGEGGRLTYWRTKWDPATSGNGVAVLTLPEGSWQAEALGSTVVPARVNFGTWDYFDGKIVIPN